MLRQGNRFVLWGYWGCSSSFPGIYRIVATRESFLSFHQGGSCCLFICRLVPLVLLGFYVSSNIRWHVKGGHNSVVHYTAWMQRSKIESVAPLVKNLLPETLKAHCQLRVHNIEAIRDGQYRALTLFKYLIFPCNETIWCYKPSLSTKNLKTEWGESG